MKEIRGIADLTKSVLAKELQADEHGIVYAAMAGFDTSAIVNENGQVNFFEDWVRALDPKRVSGVHSDPSHPSPRQRAAAVRTRLKQVLKKIDLFQWGVRFHQAGLYKNAVLAFEEFLRYFPSREVYHNLASSHHRLALKHYRLWKRNETDIPFQLSLAIDPVTRAGPRRRGGSPERLFSGSPKKLFKNHLAKAIQFYQRAISLDSAYYLSYNNLGCALLLKGDAYRAIATLQDALKISPTSSQALNNLGVAFIHAENLKKGRVNLVKAKEMDSTDKAPLFNLGLLAHKKQNSADRKKYWGEVFEN